MTSPPWSSCPEGTRRACPACPEDIEGSPVEGPVLRELEGPLQMERGKPFFKIIIGRVILFETEKARFKLSDSANQHLSLGVLRKMSLIK
jgi:hypothetical protein